MDIKVSLFANLRQYAPGGQKEFSLALPSGATVEALLRELKMTDEVQRVTLVNGRPAKDDTRLAAGDAVAVFPPFTGG